MLTTCKKCARDFERSLAHKGLANVCEDCGGKDVDRRGAKVMWTGKHTMEIEITQTLAEATKFNKKNRRLGSSPLVALMSRTPNLVFKEENHTADRGPKEQHDNNPGASYTSKLGERHSTKR